MDCFKDKLQSLEEWVPSPNNFIINDFAVTSKMVKRWSLSVVSCDIIDIMASSSKFKSTLNAKKQSIIPTSSSATHIFTLLIR